MNKNMIQILFDYPSKIVTNFLSLELEFKNKDKTLSSKW